MGPVRAGFEVSSLVRALGSEAVVAPGGQLQGVGASYADVIAILEQLAAKGMVDAKFWPGPLPKIGLPVKK